MRLMRLDAQGVLDLQRPRSAVHAHVRFRLTQALLCGSLIAGACGGGDGGTAPPPSTGGNPPGGGGGGATTVRLTVVIPPIAGGVNAAGHLVVVLTGTNVPANRAAVTVKTPTCVGAPGTTVTCPFDVPTGATVALVAEEALYSPTGVRALGSRPPDNFPVEFTGWTGDVAGEVEFGLLRLPMDRARRVEARFRLLQPITIARRSGGTETMLFRVSVTSPLQLSLPPFTPSAAPFTSTAYGGSSSEAVLWFFLRAGATATVEPLDDISAGGCVPSASQRCSRFVAWEGDCSGTGSCVLTGGASPRSVIAVSEEVGGSAPRGALTPPPRF